MVSAASGVNHCRRNVKEAQRGASLCFVCRAAEGAAGSALLLPVHLPSGTAAAGEEKPAQRARREKGGHQAVREIHSATLTPRTAAGGADGER